MHIVDDAQHRKHQVALAASSSATPWRKRSQTTVHRCAMGPKWTVPVRCDPRHRVHDRRSSQGRTRVAGRPRSGDIETAVAKQVGRPRLPRRAHRTAAAAAEERDKCLSDGTQLLLIETEAAAVRRVAQPTSTRDSARAGPSVGFTQNNDRAIPDAHCSPDAKLQLFSLTWPNVGQKTRVCTIERRSLAPSPLGGLGESEGAAEERGASAFRVPAVIT